MQLLYVVAATVGLVLRLLYFAMFLFAILSWFVSEDHPIMAVLAVITAPIIFPVRALLSRIPALERLPIDISFLVAFVLLGVVMSALPPLPLF